MEATLPDELPDDDESLDSEIVPIAERAAKVAAVYANELTTRWRTNMEISDELDREDPDFPSTTKNLTKPPTDTPASNN
jgi:hypothetical protein